jgi:hypothetical protein
MKSFEIERCDSLPPRDDLIVVRMRAMGFEIDPEAPRSALAEFWTNPED